MLFIDFSHAEPGQVMDVISEARGIIASQPHNSVNTLTDVTEVHYDRETAEALKLYTQHNKPYVRAAAVVGVVGLKKVLYRAILALTGRDIHLFDDLESARDWLAENHRRRLERAQRST